MNPEKKNHPSGLAGVAIIFGLPLIALLIYMFFFYIPGVRTECEVRAKHLGYASCHDQLEKSRLEGWSNE
jgi:hypothetical protein